MWAVHPRQSYETPKAWMKNASDLNSVIKKRERERENQTIARTGLCLENNTNRELWE